MVHSLSGGDFHTVEVNGILLSRHGSLEDDGSPRLSGQCREVEFVTLPSLFAVAAEIGRTHPCGVGTFNDVSHLQGVACGVFGCMVKREGKMRHGSIGKANARSLCLSPSCGGIVSVDTAGDESGTVLTKRKGVVSRADDGPSGIVR